MSSLSVGVHKLLQVEREEKKKKNEKKKSKEAQRVQWSLLKQPLRAANLLHSSDLWSSRLDELEGGLDRSLKNKNNKKKNKKPELALSASPGRKRESLVPKFCWTHGRSAAPSPLFYIFSPPVTVELPS